MFRCVIWAMKKTIFVCLIALALPALAQTPAAKSDALSDEFKKREIEWTNLIVKGDGKALDEWLTPDYELTIAAAGAPLIRVPRAAWLNAAETTYRIHSFEFK